MPDSIGAKAVLNYVTSQAWADRMEGWGKGYSDLIRATIVTEIANGAGPSAIASKIIELATNVPAAAAENLTRTLQITSYRDAALRMEEINGAFIERKIRIAKLDDRTCLSCIALHGTELEPGQRVDDHYNGRCSEFYVVPGGGLPEFMQADSTPGNRKFVPFQSGTEWFNSLSEERQQRQASFSKGPAKWKAFKDGVPLEDFVGEHEDDVFGNQFIEKSLKDTVGTDKAKDYYVRK